MSHFEYVSVAVALIYALVVGKLLTGLTAGLESGRRYSIHAAWVITLLLLCANGWWIFWRTSTVEWNAIRFSWALLIPSLLYVRASILVGIEPLAIPSYRDRFFEKKNMFFSVTLLEMVAVALYPWVAGLVPWLSPAPIQPIAAIVAGMSIAGLVFASPAVHAAIVGAALLFAIWSLFFLPLVPSAVS